MADSVWRVAGRYRVLGRIGAGGMADVMRAHDELLDRDVAVKVFRSVPSTPDTASGVERQHAELRALARLNHPNLTVLYDGSIVGQDGPAYLVMELIDGPSLAEAIAEGGLTAAHAAEIGAQIADALAYVHAAGMVHRDVKPANILLGDDRIADSDSGRARLTDFGIVRLIGDEPLTQADMTLGSASYLAPEQTRGSAVGPPADVYALGLSLLEALTGRRSFEGPPLEAAMARLTNDPHIPPDLPPPWPGLLAAMTARDPAHRPSAARVAKALRGSETTTAALAAVPLVPFPVGPASGTTDYIPRAATGPAMPAGPPPPPVRAPRPPDYGPGGPGDPERASGRRSSPWLIAAIAVIVALLVAGVVVLIATSGSGGGGGGGPTTAPPSTTRTASSGRATTASSSRQQTSRSAPTTAASVSTSSSRTSASTSTATSSSASTSSSAASSSASTSSSTSTSAQAGPTTTRTGTATRSHTTAPPANAAGH